MENSALFMVTTPLTGQRNVVCVYKVKRAAAQRVYTHINWVAAAAAAALTQLLNKIRSHFCCKQTTWGPEGKKANF